MNSFNTHDDTLKVYFEVPVYFLWRSILHWYNVGSHNGSAFQIIEKYQNAELQVKIFNQVDKYNFSLGDFCVQYDDCF